MKNALLFALDNEQKRLIYHLSDGNRGSVEIAELSGTSDRTVRRHWSSWVRQGLVESMKVRGGERYKKSFELEDFGIELPETKTTTVTAELKSKETREGETR